MPRDAIRIHTNDQEILHLSDRLWDRATGNTSARGKGRAPVHFSIDTFSTRAALPAKLSEDWAVGLHDVELTLGRELRARIECARGKMAARVSSRLLETEPSLVGRLLLETPAAVLLARRSYGVVHAGAVVGPRGAVVIRGAPGAGKSTLVAAAHAAGLGILGDETVLVARENPDDLLAAVRDVTLLPDAADLLDLHRQVVPANTRPENKLRLDLFHSSRPAQRRARRVATVVLGPRDRGPARLEELPADAFLQEFERGDIPQEKWSGTPDTIARYWARSNAFRLSGAADLRGAVGLLAEMVHHDAARATA